VVQVLRRPHRVAGTSNASVTLYIVVFSAMRRPANTMAIAANRLCRTSPRGRRDRSAQSSHTDLLYGSTIQRQERLGTSLTPSKAFFVQLKAILSPARMRRPQERAVSASKMTASRVTRVRSFGFGHDNFGYGLGNQSGPGARTSKLFMS